MHNFSAKTLRALARKGITIYGLQSSVADGHGDTCYKVNDNGCGRIWTFAQVLEAAK